MSKHWGNRLRTLHAISLRSACALRTLRLLNEIAKDDHTRNHALCGRVVDECFASKDYEEGRTAFMEKHKAVFTGR